MATTIPQPSSSETLTLDSTAIFLSSLSSLSPPPQTLTLIDSLKQSSSLSPIPSDFPHSKLIPNTRFVVDAFRRAGDFSISYFLSHFHSDHYAGLTHSWSKGVIFCSPITARLLVQVLNVPSSLVVPLNLSRPVWIDGCEITLIDANHCPGAVQFLFRVPSVDGERSFGRYVHTGDFRYCASMRSEPALSEFVGADALFLDTTYCNPKFVFPSQEESIDYIVNVIDRIRIENKCSPKSVLFLVATYVIGKEKILLEVARRCDCKIHVDGRKFSVLDILGSGETGVFSRDDSECDVHVVGWNVLGETWPYFRPNFVKMKEIMVERGYSRVVGFVPTGWTYEVKHNRFTVKTKDSFEIHLVPYSEHSNYEELREYVKFLRPKRVIPTVGMDVEKLDSKQVEKMQKHFAGLVDEKAIKQEFFMGFHPVLQGANAKILRNDNSIANEGQDRQTGVKPNEMIDVEKSDIGLVLAPSSSMQILRDSTILNGNWTEELIKDLRDCLPNWVTCNQLLDLLRGSDGNIVDAVSNFYERETEFHEQAISSSATSSVCAAQTSSGSDSTSLSVPATVNSSPSRSRNFVLSQAFHAASMKCAIKGNISHGKKRKHLENKPNKKARVNSPLKSSRSKQSPITKFFSKLPTNVSPGGSLGDMPVACSKDEMSLRSDAINSYKDELDQFIQIIDGDNSSRSYAATILEKAKGDVNVAVNMHYTNLEGNVNEESLLGSCRPVQAQRNVNNFTSIQENEVPEPSGKLAELSVLGLSTKDVASKFVSLPPEKYYPVEHACWRNGQPAPFLHLARTFDLLEGEKGKIKATFMICNMFRSLLALSPNDVLPAVYLCLNKIAADHENMELNIGGSLVSAALEEACGTDKSKIRDMYNSLGDLGDVAQACRQTQSLLAPPSPLLIRDVFAVLQKISVQTGTGSTVRKKNLIVNLMRSCREKEMKFLVRTLVRNLRIGAMMRTVLPALAQAVIMNSSPHLQHNGTDANLKEKLQGISAAVLEAYSILPNLDLIVPSLMAKGINFSSSILSMVPGIPINPMLAKITNGIPQALKLFQNKAFTCEYKYDGQRAQIHKLVDGSVRVFSRKGDETTSRFPDLVDIIQGQSRPDAVSFILDAEVVAVDRKNDCKLMSFQELSSRGRGSKDSSISVDEVKVNICIFVFDIMFANGEKLLGLPLRERRKHLKDLFYGEKLGYLEYAMETTVEADDACLTNEATLTKINCFLEDAFRSSCEGIMVKLLDVDAGYFPSKRVDAWLKVKRDYLEGLNDSLDLVPIGAWYGNGRKAGWYSPFLMACYNPDSEEFQSVCRVMSGFSDSFYKEMKEFYAEEKILAKKPPYYQTAEVPDLWFSPELVWQIRGADFTISPVHQAAVGLVHPSRGISVRFPRFIRSVFDRKPEECSTAADIADLFHSQTRKKDVAAAN